MDQIWEVLRVLTILEVKIEIVSYVFNVNVFHLNSTVTVQV